MSISSRIAVTTALAALTLALPLAVGAANVTLPPLGNKVPGDVAAGAEAAAFDAFSWQSFIAINSPADGSGIGKKRDAITQWEASWMSDFQILDSAGKPSAWGAPPVYPEKCQGGVYPPRPGTRSLTWMTKGTTLNHLVTPNNGPLIDQNGKFVMFEILVNRPMYDYIIANNLYTLSGQAAFKKPGGKPLSFPSSSSTEPAAGAIALKAAWKELGPTDDASRFHTAMAFIADPDPKIRCRMAKMGLVGLHISRKTANYPKWIWSTFEHKANAPTLHDEVQPPYNFNNGGPAEDPAKFNLPPPWPWQLGYARKPVEVARFIPVTATAEAANDDYTEALNATPGKSVFANYMLVGTQHPTRSGDGGGDISGRPMPSYLANTTMETYIQGDSKGRPVTNVTSSCGGCHARAVLSKTSTSSDFSYILQRASKP